MGERLMRGGWRRAWGRTGVGVAALSCATALPLSAQGSPEPVEIGGLLRTGLRVEPDSTGRSDGFEVFDARVKLSGEIGIVFDYFVQAEYDGATDAFRLLDATASLPLFEAFELTFGQFRPWFGLEARTPKGQITFLERAQASTALAPGRQVGIEVGGQALDQRLEYGVGIFNGNGRTVQNDGSDFMYAAGMRFNSIGPIPFYDDLVVQLGASLLYSDDTAAPLGDGLDDGAGAGLGDPFAGDRFVWGLDGHARYRGWELTGEYMRGDFDVSDPGTDNVVAEADAYGGYLQLAYRAWGALEGVGRYDGFQTATGSNRDFLVLGINVYPGYYAKFGLQYALGLGDTEIGNDLADGQFSLLAQIDFERGTVMGTRP